MKNLITSLTLTIFLGLGAIAQDDAAKADDGNKPAFKFETETHDFGTVTEGPKYEYEFKFTNTGKEPLIINNVRASCGCTTPVWPREPIPPGQESTIKAVYNSKGRPGKFNKAITISSNATTPSKVLYIKGNVQKAQAAPEGSPEKKPSMLAEPNKK